MNSTNSDKQKVGDKSITLPDISARDKSFTLAHLSDPHMASLRETGARELLNQRILGVIKWKLHRAAEHRDDILAALLSDLRETRPDHIAVTGDLTHLGLPAEFKKSQQLLHSLGAPATVTVVPGNHDTYIKTDWDRTFACWTEYMADDESGPPAGPATSLNTIFPSLRVRESIALIGVCSARPSAPFLATGGIGQSQLKKLAELLEETGKRRLFRVVLIHHPPVPGSISWRKRLTDAQAFCATIAHYGAELVLHGHLHRTSLGYLKTPSGMAPVIGLPSSSASGHRPERQARYNIYRIAPKDNGWEVRLSVRVFSSEKNCFTTESERKFIW